jgi:hypothetical protein
MKLILKAFPILLASLFLGGCDSSVTDRAAELINSIAHSPDILRSSSITAPKTLRSGKCSNAISQGTVNSTQASFNTFSIVALSISVDLDSSGSRSSNNTFQCDLQLMYSVDSSQQITGGGRITSCDNFSCSLNGTSISCEELSAALLKYTCSSVYDF